MSVHDIAEEQNVPAAGTYFVFIGSPIKKIAKLKLPVLEQVKNIHPTFSVRISNTDRFRCRKTS
jgi:hypothetical protein